MRKILIAILIVLLLVVGYMVIFNGLNVFGIQILSVSGMQDKNSEIDTNLQNLSTLTSVDQPKAVSDLNNSAKQLTIAKEEYNDKVLYSSNENVELATITRPYETEYLQTRLGNHAKDKGINLRYELRRASSGVAQEYDMYFTVTGSYVSISEFVSALEKDSSLAFKIESFKLVPTATSTDTLQATFTVKKINVKVDGVNRGTTSTSQTNNNTNTNSNTNTNTNGNTNPTTDTSTNS